MNTLVTTRRYYAAWLDVPPDHLTQPGLRAVPSPKRDVRQAGYARPFDLYAYIADDTTLISYGSRLADRIDAVVATFRSAPDPVVVTARLRALLGPARVQHAHKFVFTALRAGLSTDSARPLTGADYDAFLRFHRAQYADADQAAWLPDYFAGLVARGDLFGVVVDGRLVSVADVPDVPYMSDLVAEPGIVTLAGYRRRGYATAAVGALLAHLLAEGKAPLWSCGAGNVGSRALAERVGFEKFADVITVTLQP